MNDAVEKALAMLDGFRMSDEMTYSAYSALYDEISLLDDLLKVQEPALLLNQHKSGGHSINANSPWKSTCPRCGKKIEGKQTRFCKYCGRR